MGTGIPVPEVIPEGSKAFTVCVPDDPFFYGVVMGLLKQATFKYFWDGTEEQKTAVTDRMLEMYYNYQDQVGCMDCANVAGCIEGDEDTQAALAAAILSSAAVQAALNQVYNPLGVGGTMNAATRSQNLTGVNEDCDLDKLWGFIDGGIEGMNANNIDAQQSAEVISNIFERAATVVSAIPGIGVLPVDEVVSYAQGIFTDDLFEAYEANDTTGYRNELKCDLFCLAQANDCKVTVDLLRAYFLDRLSYSGADVLDEIIEFLVDGVWTDTLVNDVFYLSQIIWMQNGNKFFKIEGVMSFSTLFALGEPNDDWELLCEECETDWDFVIDFETGENVDFVTITAGDYEVGVGVHQEFRQLTNGYETINLLWNTEATSRLTHYEVDADYSAGELAGGADATFYFGWNASPETVITAPATPTFPEAWDGDSPGSPGGGTGLQIMPGVHIGTGDPGGTALLRRITLHGTGTPPA